MNKIEVAARIKAHWKGKILLGTGLTLGFWAFYFSLQRLAIFPVHTMQPSSIDRIVPFMPGAVYLYESFWFLMPLSPWLMTSEEELRRYSAGILFMSAIGFIVFFFFPTFCPRPKALPGVNGLYGALIQIDKELNSFPSLHAAFAVFHGACCHATFSPDCWPEWLRGFIWLWVFGIIASTLLTKQHVAVDAVAGIMLGFAGYSFCFRDYKIGLTTIRSKLK